MRRWILTVLATLGVFSATALAQATLETLMTHSVSTSVGTNAGTALDRATNALAGRVAQQTSTTTSRATSPQTILTPRHGAAATRRTQTATASTAWVPDKPLPGNGSLIASIQGGERQTTGCRVSTNSGDAKSTGETAAQNCGARAPQAADHPSVINLPAPQ